MAMDDLNGLGPEDKRTKCQQRHFPPVPILIITSLQSVVTSRPSRFRSQLQGTAAPLPRHRQTAAELPSKKKRPTHMQTHMVKRKIYNTITISEHSSATFSAHPKYLSPHHPSFSHHHHRPLTTTCVSSWLHMRQLGTFRSFKHTPTCRLMHSKQ